MVLRHVGSTTALVMAVRFSYEHKINMHKYYIIVDKLTQHTFANTIHNIQTLHAILIMDNIITHLVVYASFGFFFVNCMLLAVFAQCSFKKKEKPRI